MSNSILKWDLRYLRLAKHVALWSKDPSTKCGAIIVRDDHTLASLGFNGFHRHMEDKPEWLDNREEKYPRILHSEWNSIQNTKEYDFSKYSVYAWPMPPCNACTASLIQKKLRRCVCLKPNEEKLSRWATQFTYALDMWQQVGAEVVHVPSEIELELYPHLCYMSPDLIGKWDDRFLEIAREVQTWSKDVTTPRSTILIRPDNTVSSLGFNGYPQGVNDFALQNPSPSNKEERDAQMISSERNAILFSRDTDMSDYKAFCWPGPPSLNASVHLLAKGVKHLYYAYVGVDTIEPSVKSAWEEVGGTITAIEIKEM